MNLESEPHRSMLKAQDSALSTESTAQLQKAQDARRAALNLMEDAVRARQAIETLNEELRAREEQFRAVFNQTTGGIAQTDLTGRFTLVNDRYCDIVGRPREELLTLRMHDITHPDDLSAHAEQFRVLVQGGSNFIVEKRYLRSDGSMVWVHNDVASVRDSLGRVVHVVAAVTDITERKQTETRLVQFTAELEQRVSERTQELAQSENRLRTLATELNLAEQRERKRLATDLHDYLAQLLVLCRMTLGQAKKTGLPQRGEDFVKETEQTVDKALAFCRTLMTELSPPVLQERGLPAGLLWLGEHMKRHELAVSVDHVEVVHGLGRVHEALDGRDGLARGGGRRDGDEGRRHGAARGIGRVCGQRSQLLRLLGSHPDEQLLDLGRGKLFHHVRGVVRVHALQEDGSLRWCQRPQECGRLFGGQLLEQLGELLVGEVREEDADLVRVQAWDDLCPVGRAELVGQATDALLLALTDERLDLIEQLGALQRRHRAPSTLGTGGDGPAVGGAIVPPTAMRCW